MELRSILQIVGETTRKPSTAIVCRLCHLCLYAQRLESSLYSTVAATKPLRLKKNLVATPGSDIQFEQPRGKGAERHCRHDSKKGPSVLTATRGAELLCKTKSRAVISR